MIFARMLSPVFFMSTFIYAIFVIAYTQWRTLGGGGGRGGGGRCHPPIFAQVSATAYTVDENNSMELSLRAVLMFSILIISL